MTRTETQLTDDINTAISDDDLGRTKILLDEWFSLFPMSYPTFLQLACGIGSVPMVELLLAHGIEVDINVIMAACKSNNLDIFQAFLNSGWDINTHYGYMGDLLALSLETPSLLAWTLAHGADPNLNVNNASFSVLDLAAMCESIECVKTLIEAGAHINNTNALKYAARYGRTEIMELLIANGAGIDEIPRPDHSDDLMDYGTGMGTALHEAAVAGELAAIQLLLVKGADPTLKNVIGKTALELAQENDHVTVVDVLRERL